MTLGAFEELVLLAVGALKDKAYGVSIKEAIHGKTSKNPSIGALHSALYRLEEKGCLTSTVGGATSERGGRRKKYYQLTATGRSKLIEAQQLRPEFSKNIPRLNLSTH